MINLSYVLRRIIMAALVLFSVSVLTFTASRILPSDPAALFAGARPTAQQIELARTQLGLDKPLIVQYGMFAHGVLTGDFGISFRTKRSIGEDISNYLPATLELIAGSMLITFFVGVPMGVIASARPNRSFDQLSRFVAICGVSIPVFGLAVILQLLFFRWLHWLPLSGRISRETSLFNPIEPVTGFNTIDAVIGGNFVALLDVLSHMVLPAIALSVYPVGLAIRMTRASMGETMQERFIVAAKSMGMRSNTILFKLALKNAMAPTLTVLGLSFAYSLTGAFIVEVIFAWPGLGKYVTDAILDLDFPVIMAVTLVATGFYVLVNVIVDIAQAALDPRIKLQ